MREAVLDIEDAVMGRHVQADVDVELIAQVAQKRVVLVMRERIRVLMDVRAENGQQTAKGCGERSVTYRMMSTCLAASST